VSEPRPRPKLLWNEASLVQNEGLGSILIWRFVAGYMESARSPCPMPLCFAVLPVVFNGRLLEVVLGTQKSSGLRKFREKLSGRQDDLLTIQRRMLSMREVSLRSLAIAARQGLVAIDIDTAGVSQVGRKLHRRGVPERVWDLMKASERLGVWCGNCSDTDVAAILRLEF
jgi:hypothetical protein